MVGITESYLEILEFPQDLVPDPIPTVVSNRLDKLEQALAGRIRKMPVTQCPFHGCLLQRLSGSAQLGRKLKSWLAKCGTGDEVYVVRSDGLIQNARRLKSRGPGGRRPKADTEKRSLQIGFLVEEERQKYFERLIKTRRSLPKKVRQNKDSIGVQLLAKGFTPAQVDAGLSAKTATIAARNFISASKNLQSITVANYHRAFLKYQLFG